MTNEEYIARIQDIRTRPAEQQIPAFMELLGERAASQASGAVVAVVEPLQREVKTILTTLHELANGVMRQYEAIDNRLGGLERREEHLLNLFAHFQEDRARHDSAMKERLDALSRWRETTDERLVALERQLDRLRPHARTEDDR